MNLFKRKDRSTRPVPTLCLPKENDVVDAVSLEVPLMPRGRSSSFDVGTLLKSNDSSEDLTLQVPSAADGGFAGSTSDENTSDKESKTSHMLKIPKYYRRRSLEIPKICIHCVHMESLSSQETTPTSPGCDRFGNANALDTHISYGSSSDSDDEADDDDDNDDDDHDDSDSCSVKYLGRGHRGSCPENGQQTKPAFNWDPKEIAKCAEEKRKKICSSFGMSLPRRVRMLFGSGNCTPSDSDAQEKEKEDCGQTVVTLQVPMTKPRSSSMDAAYLPLPLPLGGDSSLQDSVQLDAPIQRRSSSVDVTLPTEESSHYKAIARVPDGFK